MAVHCELCGKMKPFLFGNFVRCSHCHQIFCPRCSDKFTKLGGYPQRIEMYKCPICKRVGLRGMW